MAGVYGMYQYIWVYQNEPSALNKTYALKTSGVVIKIPKEKT